MINLELTNKDFHKFVRNYNEELYSSFLSKKGVDILFNLIESGTLNFIDFMKLPSDAICFYKTHREFAFDYLTDDALKLTEDLLISEITSEGYTIYGNEKEGFIFVYND